MPLVTYQTLIFTRHAFQGWVGIPSPPTEFDKCMVASHGNLTGPSSGVGGK
jgi:hypothetical protein